MGTMRNFLSGTNATFMVGGVSGGLSAGDWSATTGTITPSMAYSRNDEYDSLFVQPSANAFEFLLADIEVPGDYYEYEFHAWVLVPGTSAVSGETSIQIQVGIESATNVVMTPTSMVRTNGVVTATVDTSNIRQDEYITVSGCSSSFNGSFRITSVFQNTISWSDSGADETSSVLGSIEVYAPTKTTTASITSDPKNWTLIRSNRLFLVDDGSSKSLTVTISGTGANFSFYMTRPTLVASLAWLDNRYLMRTTNVMPEYIIDADQKAVEAGELPDFPFMRYMDVALAGHNDVLNDFFEFAYIDIEDGKDSTDVETLSQFVDPAAVRTEFFPWLLSVTGNDFSNPGLTSTPWGNLPSDWLSFMTVIDAATTTVSPSDLTRSSGTVTATVASSTGFATNDYIVVSGATPSSFNGTFRITGTGGTSITWAQAGTNESTTVDGLITKVDTEWGEIANYAPDLLGLVAYLRWIAQYGAFGNWAGTKRGLEDAIQQNLINDKSFTLTYAYGGDPWAIRISSVATDTQGGVVGNPNQGLLDAVELSRPCGYVLSHICT
jgi:hypothetical protein